jgi:hypothetical protein
MTIEVLGGRACGARTGRMSNPLVDFYRFPEGALKPSSQKESNWEHSESPLPRVSGDTDDWSSLVRITHASNETQFMRGAGASSQSPLDVAAAIDDLRLERYATKGDADRTLLSREAIRRIYYSLRPCMPDPLRRGLQRLYLRNWNKLPFPNWPLDTSVEETLERLLIFSMKILKLERIPFIWFWPEGAPSAAIVTHDVEAEAGMRSVSRLMDVDDEFGIKASFQLVPEERYVVTRELLDSIRRRDCEVNVHGLNHDGNLFGDRSTYLRQVEKINAYVREFEADGFRSACMYRNVDWYDRLDVSYDMSVPNVAHLEPQRGGCCTVFPYFIGKVLELPLTTSQDYTLFHILGDYTTNLWMEQMSLIAEKHGLMSFITHPDYILADRALPVYRSLLDRLATLRRDKKVWIALPREVNRWWRQRSEMSLEWEDGSWHIRGNGQERARVAYASVHGERVIYEVQPSEVLPGKPLAT